MLCDFYYSSLIFRDNSIFQGQNIIKQRLSQQPAPYLILSKAALALFAQVVRSSSQAAR